MQREYLWIILALALFAASIYFGRGPVTHCATIGDVITLGCY